MLYKKGIKRTMDVLASLMGLIILCPVIIAVLIGLFFANQGKPFFFQNRPGKNAKLFRIIKFKTMNDKKDAHGNLLPDAARLAKVG
jgi:lipopolysaccharide/colanic/teichoic acid biosynthesis glycosyltransferase